ncbi:MULTISPECIES: hypothetical protein [unclassified Mycolicibacterium]|uniref:hypothetical protein n=1 Tax=unclassified Mycolicibacterium TaxID=2636767 RepID=UPI0012DE1D78|nr:MULTISPECIES: hypothetical protein [unclassified Mycolicibacterium]MUL81243.1 hypothetical protein [Mycolicibacterium sp. CBMA 329]MUL87009.1 hypothetical protein [Mycolicibacterium sp. CBMA 331]MUL98708.1 hypothetical protein [Mycolicibacterium sp. CBMA 334]MUM25571.1 hypothetical protein [Mycolicibacterium sp. CBMA 295]MUM37306.1 hypothetical protein [Mycolicibacterium sp. CBMA 247]
MTAIAEAATALADAAFGADPGRWPLPSATTPYERWLRAVAAGGQGRYGCALTELAMILRSRDAGPLVSLAYSTRASFLRQLGGHTRARGADGLAWAHCGDDDEAAADALVGLAADALGVGRFGVSARLLDRARAIDTAGNPRQRVRLSWVSAELAMARGDGAEAVQHARRGVAAAAEHSSTRHTVKSDVVLAAALCSAGELEAAREVADTALLATEKSGLIPLRWALACLLADIGSTAHDAAQIAQIRDLSADTVRRRGGVWSGA